MRERLNLRVGCDSRRHSRSFTASAADYTANGPRVGPADGSIRVLAGDQFMPPPRQRPRMEEYRDEEPETYAGRIVTLAKKTIGSLFFGASNSRHSRDDADSGHRHGAPQPQPPTPRTPPNTPFVPTTHGHGGDASGARPTTFGFGDMEGRYEAGGRASNAPSHLHPQLQTERAASIPIPDPRASESALGRMADSVVSVPAAPNVTVYQFFNTTAEPQAPVPTPWYGRHSYGAPSAYALGAADVRPVIQYTRQRSQQEAMRPLEAPPLRARPSAAAQAPASASSSAWPSKATPQPEGISVVSPNLSVDAATSRAAPPPATAPPKPNAAPFSLFTAGSTAAPAPAKSAATAASSTATAAPSTNSFFKAGPAAVMPDDDGFASDAGSSDGDEAVPPKEPVRRTEAPKAVAVPAFGFPGSTTAKPPAPVQQPTKGAVQSPFSFSSPQSPPPATEPKSSGFFGGSASPAAPSPTAPKAPAFGSGAPAFGSGAPAFGSGATSTGASGFVKAGPPAVMPDDDGFASDADKSDADSSQAPPDTEKQPVKPSFGAGSSTPSFGAPISFGSGGFGSKAPAAPSPTESKAPAFGSGAPAFGSGAPAFGSGAPAFGSGAPAFGSGAPAFGSGAPSTGASGFFKAGPPAVMPDDDGFASDADKSDGEDADSNKRTRQEDAAPAKPVFSFGFSAGSSAGGKPPNPFGFNPSSSA